MNRPVDTLIQLRQPQLSKNPDEGRLSEALTHALRPLDRAALEDVAEAMSELTDIRRDLEEIEAMRKAIGAFGTRLSTLRPGGHEARTLLEGSVKLLAAWRQYGQAAQALHIPEVDAVLDELELWHTTQSGMNPMRAALDRVLQLVEQDFAARAAALADERRLLASCASSISSGRSAPMRSNSDSMRNWRNSA